LTVGVNRNLDVDYKSVRVYNNSEFEKNVRVQKSVIVGDEDTTNNLGQITYVTVTAEGSGYNDASECTLQLVSGGPAGTGGRVKVDEINSTGGIVQLSILDGGLGHNDGAIYQLIGGSGSNGIIRVKTGTKSVFFDNVDLKRDLNVTENVEIGTNCNTTFTVNSESTFKCNVEIEGDANIGGNLTVSGGSIVINGEEFDNTLESLNDTDIDGTAVRLKEDDVVLFYNTTSSKWEEAEIKLADTLSNSGIVRVNDTVEIGGNIVSSNVGITNDGTLYSSLSGSLVFRAQVDVSQSPVGQIIEPKSTGDLYVHFTGNGTDVADVAWTGLAGLSVDDGSMLAWSEAGARWYILGELSGVDLDGYVRKTGDIMSGPLDNQDTNSGIDTKILTVANDATLLEKVQIGDDCAHTLTVEATSEFKCVAKFNTDVTIGGNLTVDNNVSIGGNLNVDNIGDLTGGGINIDTDLNLGNNNLIGGNITIDGSTGNITTEGSVNIDGVTIGGGTIELPTGDLSDVFVLKAGDSMGGSLLANSSVNDFDSADDDEFIPKKLIEGELDVLSNNITTLEGALGDSVTAINAEFDKHATSIANLDGDITLIEGSIGGINTSIDGINTTLSAHRDSILTLDGSVSANTESIIGIQGDIGDINTSIGGINTTLSAHRDSILTLDGSVSANTESIIGIQGSIGSIDITLGQHATSIGKLGDSILQLDQDITDIRNDFTSAAGARVLNDLFDVSVDGAAAGESLVFNGTGWVSDTVSTVTTLGELTNVKDDVDTLAGKPYQYLTWNPNDEWVANELHLAQNNTTIQGAVKLADSITIGSDTVDTYIRMNSDGVIYAELPNLSALQFAGLINPEISPSAQDIANPLGRYTNAAKYPGAFYIVDDVNGDGSDLTFGSGGLGGDWENLQGEEVRPGAMITAKADLSGWIRIGYVSQPFDDLDGYVKVQGDYMKGQLQIGAAGLGLVVDNDAKLDGNVTIGNACATDLVVNSKSEFNCDVTINSGLTFGPGAELNGTVGIDDLVLDGTLSVNGGAHIGGDLTIDGTLVVDGIDLGEINLDSVGGNFTVGGNLDVLNGATIEGGLLVDGITVDGDVSIGGGLVVDGDITLNGSITSDVTVEGDLFVDGDVSISGGLEVDGDLTLNGSIASDVTVEGDLFVDGDISLSGGVAVEGDISLGGTLTGDFDVDATIDLGNSTITGSPVIDITPEGILHGHKLTIEGGLVIDGTPTINGGIQIDGDITLGGSIQFPDGNRPDFELGNTTIDGNVSIGGGIDLGGNATIGGDISIGGGAIIEGLVSLGGGLEVNGGITGDSINISGDATIGGVLDVGTIAGGAVIDGPVTIGTDCTQDLIIGAKTTHECTTTFNKVAYAEENVSFRRLDILPRYISIKADTTAGGVDNFSQTLQSKDGTIALVEDILLSEAVLLLGTHDFEDSVSPYDASGFRPGSTEPVSGDTFIQVSDSGATNTYWTDKLATGNEPTRDLKAGDKFTFIRNFGQADETWFYIPVPVEVDLDVVLDATQNTITSSAGDDVILIGATTVTAGLMTAADKALLDSVPGLTEEIFGDLDSITGSIGANFDSIAANADSIQGLLDLNLPHVLDIEVKDRETVTGPLGGNDIVVPNTARVKLLDSEGDRTSSYTMLSKNENLVMKEDTIAGEKVVSLEVVIDESSQVLVSATAPTPSDYEEGTMWWDSATGQMFVLYLNGDGSNIWVQSSY